MSPYEQMIAARVEASLQESRRLRRAAPPLSDDCRVVEACAPVGVAEWLEGDEGQIVALVLASVGQRDEYHRVPVSDPGLAAEFRTKIGAGLGDQLSIEALCLYLNVETDYTWRVCPIATDRGNPAAWAPYCWGR